MRVEPPARLDRRAGRGGSAHARRRVRDRRRARGGLARGGRCVRRRGLELARSRDRVAAREERRLGGRGARGLPPRREQARPGTALRVPGYVHDASVGTRARRSIGPWVTPSRSRARRAIARSCSRCCCRSQRAAEKSALVRALVDSGDVYHPLAWTRAGGLRVSQGGAGARDRGRRRTGSRLVDPARHRRGRRSPSPSAGGPRRSSRQTPCSTSPRASRSTASRCRTRSAARSSRPPKASCSSAADGSRPTAQRLGEVLGHWQRVERAAKRDGIPFHEALRLVAGASLDGDAASALPDAAREWSRVEAGPWMKGVLDGLRAPGATRGDDPGDDLKAALRPVPARRRALALVGSRAGPRRVPRRRHGPRQDVQVLALLLLRKRRRGARPALLVVPASLVANWTSEAARFAPSLRILVGARRASTRRSRADAVRTPRSLDEADAVITTYGTLPRVAWLREREWGLVVLDEAQAIKNPGARQTRAAKAVRARVARRAHRHPGREPARRSLVALRLPAARPARRRQGVRRAPRSAWRRASRTATRRCAGSLGPYILRRLKTDRRIIADLPDKTEVHGLLRPDPRAGRRSTSAPSTIWRRSLEDARGHRAARRDPRVADALQADLQPPVAVAGRRRVGPRSQRQARAPARDCRGRSRPGRRRCSSSPSSAR